LSDIKTLNIMKKRILVCLFLLSVSSVLYSQNYLLDGFVPKNSFLIGAESGGMIGHIEPEYSINGNDYWYWSYRVAPKIAYSPFNNFLTGGYYIYEKAVFPNFSNYENWGYGIFSRLYLPQINKILKLNNRKFTGNRILFFSEIYFENNNFMLDQASGNTATLDKLNTIFYGIKIGSNFRLFNKLYIELAYVKNFDNCGGDFDFFHPELGIEYIFSRKNTTK
jgi:hypothetical protein